MNIGLVLRYARNFAESNMTSTVQIVRKMAPEFNPVTGALQANGPIPVYEGRARIYSVSGPVRYSIGDELAYYSNSYISIPMNALQVPMIDDLIRVVAHPSDPSLVERLFQVTDTEAGGQFTTVRRMSVQSVQASQQWIWPATISEEPGQATASGNLGGISA